MTFGRTLLLRLIRKLSMGFDSSSPSPTVLIFLVKVIVSGCVTRLPEKSARTPRRSTRNTLFGSASLANCYFAHNSSGFPALLPCFDAPSGGTFHPFPCYPGPPARTWRRPFPSCGVTSPQAPTPDRESLPATIAQSALVGPHPRRTLMIIQAREVFCQGRVPASLI
jgi:hypothetical protein